MNNCTKITIGCRTSMEVHMFDSFPSLMLVLVSVDMNAGNRQHLQSKNSHPLLLHLLLISSNLKEMCQLH